nr:hypothetical protein [Clostridia bacterium]
ALYSKEENASMSIADATHGFSTDVRQSAVNFFRKHLLGLDESFIADPNRSIFDPKQLWATKSGMVLREFDDFKPAWKFAEERMDEIKYTNTKSPVELKKRVIESLSLPISLENRPEIKYPRVISDMTVDGIRVRKMFFFTDTDIICSGTLLSEPDYDGTHCTVYVSDNSTTDVFANRADIERLLLEGAVFVFDPRGTGSVAFGPMTEAQTKHGIMHSATYKLNCDAMMLGTSLAAYRIYDTLCAYDLMKGYFGFTDVTLAGRESGALYILDAAVILNVRKTSVFGEVFSFEKMVREEYHPIDPRYFIHGVLKFYDTPLLMEMLGTHKYM